MGKKAKDFVAERPKILNWYGRKMTAALDKSNVLWSTELAHAHLQPYTPLNHINMLKFRFTYVFKWMFFITRN